MWSPELVTSKISPSDAGDARITSTKNYFHQLEPSTVLNFKSRFILIVVALTLASSQSFAGYQGINLKNCPVDRDSFDRVLNEVRNHNPDALSSLSHCLRRSHKLVFQVCLIDPSQLAKAPNIMRNDENFVFRLAKVHPEILQYASDNLRGDKAFIERLIYVNRDSLQYADPKLLNNLLFMKRMIQTDSRNYMFASNRIKAMPEHSGIALSDNGMLLMYAPESVQNNKELVKIALQSNVLAFDFASDTLRDDKELQKIVGEKPLTLDKDELEKFLREKYVNTETKRNLGLTLNDKMTFHSKHRLINRNYITKWQRTFHFNGRFVDDDIKLITVDSRNSPKKWKEDLKKQPALIKKIENFFLSRQIDQSTIDDLSLAYLWEIKNQPLTLAFHLYLLRDSNDTELGDHYGNITSLTTIAQKNAKNEWHLTVVEVIFDSKIALDIPYENGHKKYFLQDLYFVNHLDKNPKLLFRVEDRFTEYFEIFEEQHGGKYQLIYRIDPIKKAELDI